MNQIYKCQTRPLTARSYSRVKKQAIEQYKVIASRTKRLPYIRSPIWHKRKVFLHLYWNHLMQKSLKDRTRRLVFLAPSFELLKNARIKPETKTFTHDRLHRLYGVTQARIFVVQVKEDAKQKLYFMSCFPWENKKPRR